MSRHGLRARRGSRRRHEAIGPHPHLAARDLFDESLASILARPGRSVLTVLGTVVGVAALVATLGLSKTAGNRIVGRFDELSATDVVATPRAQRPGSGGSVLPWDAAVRAERLTGVVAAGTMSDVDLRGDLIRAVPVIDPLRATEQQLPVRAASPGLFRAVHAVLGSGRVPDAGHSARADRVAVLGRNAAARLNVTRVDRQPAIYLGDRVYVVLGIVSTVGRQSSLLGSVIIPEGTARQDFGVTAPSAVQVETRVGAAQTVAGELGLALDPSDPNAVKVVAPPEPRRAKQGVQSDLDSLFLLLGAVSLLVGAIGIANITLMSVLERVREIGLRRSLGAARRHIAWQFLLESTTLGLIGGIVGAAVGTVVVVAVAAAHTWTPVLEPWIPLAAPLLGGSVGLLAGAYPSVRAARLEPVDALRAAV